MFGIAQLAIMTLITLALFIVEVFAFLDAARRPSAAYVSAGKRTKTFWAALTGVAALLGFVGLYPPLGGAYLGMAALFVVVPAIIYLTDVRPAVGGYRGPRGGSGPRRPNSGGW